MPFIINATPPPQAEDMPEALSFLNNIPHAQTAAAAPSVFVVAPS
jgi:hypothetical protein